MARPTPSKILNEVEDGVAVLTLNRPASLNAFDEELRREFTEAVRGLAADAEVGAVVVTGTGRAFSAGGDIREMPERLDGPAGEIGPRGWSRLKRNQEMILALHNLEKPTIAAVNGPAAGLGMDLALACDFIVASGAASFRMSFVLRGLVPDGGGMHFLPRRIGIARAKALIFSGDAVDAATALEVGLVDRLSPPESLLADARAWASLLGKQPRVAVALAKSILNASFETTLEQSFAASNQAQAICYTTADHRRLVEAFMSARSKK
jgi:enoyl-CoA hydratase/carnithine racemase